MADNSYAKERTALLFVDPYNPLTAWARNGEVEVDSAVYDAHTWSCCYPDSAAGGSVVTLNRDEAVQEEGYHGEGAQVR
jgi:hypothetical protein